MAPSPWYVEIVRVSSIEKQQDLLRLLREVVGVTALGTSVDSEHFVIFDCSDVQLKIAVEALFDEVDPTAVLIQVHRQALQPEGGGVA